MRWQIKGFEFCELQQSLTFEQNITRIEPMMVELLAYFCRHPNDIISKEQLLNDVWQGRVVSDNTVSKLITKLRKALADDARNPKFIATVPKRGYRFIAPITQIVADDELTQVTIASKASDHPEQLPSQIMSAADKQDEDSPPALSPARIKRPAYLLLLVVLLNILLLWFVTDNVEPEQVMVSAKAVTSDEGSEHFPSFAKDGEHFAYMNHDGNKFRLFVKNTHSGEQVEIEHGSSNGVGPGNWNMAGTKLVYLVASKENCQYFIRDIDGLTMSAPRLIHTCRAGSFGAIKFTHDDNILVFSESTENGKPYSLYSLNVDTGKTQWLPQPELHLGGNSQFDMHPTENKLLISSPDIKQWEGFYQLDLDTQQLDLLFSLNAYICCGIWSHDGEHVVLMGEHPARNIVQYDLSGDNETILFSGPLQLHRPERHSNGIDYVFTAFKSDLNIERYDLKTQRSESILSDTFDERLAVFSPDAKLIAYISLTSGNEELWLFDNEKQSKKKVTRFQDGRHYLDLAWSPDQQKIAGLTLNEIHVIDLATGTSSVLPLPEKEFRGISFKSPNKLAYSVKINERWQVVEFNLADNTMTRLDAKWQSVRFTSSPDDWLWVDQDGNWYQGEAATPVTMPNSHLSPFYGRQFNVHKNGQNIAFYNWQQEHVEIYQLDNSLPDGSVLIHSLPSQLGHFSINGNTLLLSQKSSEINDSDIYRTFRVSTD